MFAILDQLQWNHPLVLQGEELRGNDQLRNCTLDPQGVRQCMQGCPETRLKRIIVSGYNADTGHLQTKLLLSLYLNIPFQAAPVKLGIRATSPIWNNVLGWSYSFQACPSNFLDCFFLDHSPCPYIEVDIEAGPGHLKVDKDRFTDTIGRRIDEKKVLLWYQKAVGMNSNDPIVTIGKFTGLPLQQVTYSYLFRPRYFVRKEIYKRVEAFDLHENCSIMHVRRGDSGILLNRFQI